MRVLTVLLYIICMSVSEKVLMVFPSPMYSHYSLAYKLMKILTERGHEVTFISAFQVEHPPKLCRQIYLGEFTGVKVATMKGGATHLRAYNAGMYGINLVNRTFSHPQVWKLLESGESFDAVITHAFISPYFVFGHIYKAPLIVLSVFGATKTTNELVANPAPWSYIPEAYLPYSSEMSFLQRIENVFIGIYRILLDKYCIYPKSNEVLHQHFPGVPGVETLIRNVSLVLLNSHLSVHTPIPLQPNIVEIGGYHIDPPKKLPEDLQKYLDDSKNGAIFFCMGSNINKKNLPVDTTKILLAVFSKLKQNVLWKTDLNSSIHQPRNVKILPWLPQNDLLGHHNVKIFITHGGLLSMMEAVYHGIPIIGLPVFSDQNMNVDFAVSKGFGVRLDLDSLDEKIVSSAISEVLNDPRYKNSAVKQSTIIRDRISSPKETAVYWVEYVMRHKGAYHLRSNAMKLEWYELYLVDVAFTFIVTICFIAYVLYIVIKYATRTSKIKEKSC